MRFFQVEELLLPSEDVIDPPSGVGHPIAGSDLYVGPTRLLDVDDNLLPLGDVLDSVVQRGAPHRGTRCVRRSNALLPRVRTHSSTRTTRIVQPVDVVLPPEEARRRSGDTLH